MRSRLDKMGLMAVFAVLVALVFIAGSNSPQTQTHQVAQDLETESAITRPPVEHLGGGASDAPKRSELCDCALLPRLWLTEPRMTGQHVQDLQQGLAIAGFLSTRLDGVFGPGTHEAVVRFQESQGMNANGIVDSDTWSSLAEVCEGILAESLAVINPVVPRKAPKPQDIKGWVAILVDLTDYTLTLLEDGKPLKQYRVCIGEPETPTPLGHWVITSKAVWDGGFGTRWMAIDVPWGKFGIHGTNKPWTVGTRKSSGCVRMLNRDIEELFNLVKVGTPVRIVGGPFGNLGSTRPTIRPGAKGGHVMEVQRRLIKLGYPVSVDGVYGLGTETTIMRLQKDKGLPATGIVDGKTYDALGLFHFE